MLIWIIHAVYLITVIVGIVTIFSIVTGFSRFKSRFNRAHFGIHDPMLDRKSNKQFILYNKIPYIRGETRRAPVSMDGVLTKSDLNRLYPAVKYHDWLSGIQSDQSKSLYKSIFGMLNWSKPTPANSNRYKAIQLKSVSKFVERECTICFDRFDKDDLIRGLSCGHSFHQNCIDKWLTQRRGICPSCNKSQHEQPLTLDEIVGVNYSNPYAFELLSRLTAFKAKVILAAFCVESLGGDINKLKVDSKLKLYDQPEDVVIAGDETVPLKLQMRLPKTSQLNHKIMNILRTYQFSKFCLHNIDKTAYVKAREFYRDAYRIYLGVLGVEFTDVYYHFVVQEFLQREQTLKEFKTMAV